MPGQKNLKRRGLLAKVHDREMKQMEQIEKVAMTTICRWCHNKMSESRAICNICYHCQYCGLQPTNLIQCDFCSNKDLDHKVEPIKRINAVLGAAQAVQKRKRVVRRSGPRLRNTR